MQITQWGSLMSQFQVATANQLSIVTFIFVFEINLNPYKYTQLLEEEESSYSSSVTYESVGSWCFDKSMWKICSSSSGLLFLKGDFLSLLRFDTFLDFFTLAGIILIEGAWLVNEICLGKCSKSTLLPSTKSMFDTTDEGPFRDTILIRLSD